MTRYVLPELPYDYGALEPHLSGRLLELHHDKHHKAYVEGANKALERLEEARSQGDFSMIAALERQLAFNVSGHLLHSLFWQNLTPRGGGQPEGSLGEALQRDFGGFEPFKRQVVQAASTTMGSGWAALFFDPVGCQLLVGQLHDHQSEVPLGTVPLMVLDAWEHAYYLQYQSDKASFFEAVWRLWNFEDIQRRYEAAQQLDLKLLGAAEGAAPVRRLPAEQPVAH